MADLAPEAFASDGELSIAELRRIVCPTFGSSRSSTERDAPSPPPQQVPASVLRAEKRRTRPKPWARAAGRNSGDDDDGSSDRSSSSGSRLSIDPESSPRNSSPKVFSVKVMAPPRSPASMLRSPSRARRMRKMDELDEISETMSDVGDGIVRPRMSSSASTLPGAAGTSAGAGGRAGKGQKGENPFVEYEDRERERQKERRWLQEDPIFLKKRSQRLKKQSVRYRLDTANRSNDELYSNAVYYGNYSMQVRALSALRQEMKRIRRDGEAGDDMKGTMSSMSGLGSSGSLLPALHRAKTGKPLQADQPEPEKSSRKRAEVTASSVRTLRTLKQDLKESGDHASSGTGWAAPDYKDTSGSPSGHRPESPLAFAGLLKRFELFKAE